MDKNEICKFTSHISGGDIFLVAFLKKLGCISTCKVSKHRVTHCTFNLFLTINFTPLGRNMYTLPTSCPQLFHSDRITVWKDNSIYNCSFKHCIMVTFQGRAFFDMVCPQGYIISGKFLNVRGLLDHKIY